MTRTGGFSMNIASQPPSTTSQSFYLQKPITAPDLTNLKFNQAYSIRSIPTKPMRKNTS